MPEMIEDKQQDIDLLSGEYCLVGVYGSLKHGEGNHRLLTGSKLIGVTTTPPIFNLLDLGSFPGMIDGDERVVVEVYKVSQDTLQSLDRLEGHPTFYKRVEVPLELNGSNKDVWIYILQDDHGAPYLNKNSEGALDWVRRVFN